MNVSGDALRGTAQVSLAAIAWGTWSLYLRPTGLSGAWTAPIVLLVIGVTALPLLRLESAPTWDRRSIAMLLAYALADAINAGMFFAAMQITTIAVAVLTHCAAPLIVALLAPRFDGVRVPGSVPAACVALLGLALLLRPWEAATADANLLLGGLLGFASALGYAAAVFLGKALSARVGVGRATSFHALCAVPLFVPFALASNEVVEASDLGLLALGGVISGTLASWLFLDGLRRIGSARAAVLTFLEPLVAVLVGWLAFSETLTWVGGVGGLLVLGAAAYVARAQPRTE